MSNELQVFSGELFGNVRVQVDEQNEPWFVAKDVAVALGYEWNGSKNTQHVPEEWRGVETVSTPSGTQEMIMLSEQGLYFFLGRSDKPKALPYQKWIAGEVIPSIRKHGGYMVTKETDTPELILARAVILAQETIKRIESENKQLEHKIATDAPKVNFAESVAVADTVISVGEMAKLICQSGKASIGQNRLFEWLRANGYLHKEGAQYNIPTQKSIDLGVLCIRETTTEIKNGRIILVCTPKVTAKGQLYFMNKFSIK